MECFVVMPIGEQLVGETKLSSDELRKRYDDLIKEAICAANPDISVIRSDEISKSGSITNEIFKRLILSEYVVVDVSFPNPNVFYELGLRHAIRNKTILIKDTNSMSVPFDIINLRYIEYENTPSGLKKLKTEFQRVFDEFKKNPKHIDNDFLKLIMSFNMIRKNKSKKEAFIAIIKNKELMNAILSGNDSKAAELLSKSDDIDNIISALVDSGEI